MLRLIALLLLTPFVLAQETRFNPFRGKEMPVTPRLETAQSSIDEFQRFEKKWKLSEDDYEALFEIVKFRHQSEKSLEALVKVLEAHASPQNAALIFYAVGDFGIGDPKIQARFLKVMADSFYDQEAWHRAIVVAGKNDKRLELIDEAAIANPMPRRAWWLSERFARKMLGRKHFAAAFVIIGREGSPLDHEMVKLATYSGMWGDKYNKQARDGLDTGIRLRTGNETETANSEYRSRFVPFDPDRDSSKGTSPQSTSSPRAVIEYSEFQELLSSRDDEEVREALRFLIREKQAPRPDALIKLMLSSERGEKLRIEALAAMPVSDKRFVTCKTLLNSEKTPPELRLEALKKFVDPAPTKLLDLILLQDLLPAAREEEQRVIAKALASTQEGANLLLASAQSGKILAAIMRDAAIVEKLKAVKIHDLDERLKSLPK